MFYSLDILAAFLCKSYSRDLYIDDFVIDLGM
jgi:hypothetical protein